MQETSVSSGDEWFSLSPNDDDDDELEAVLLEHVISLCVTSIHYSDIKSLTCAVSCWMTSQPVWLDFMFTV